MASCNRYEKREWLPYPGWNTVTYVPPGEWPKLPRLPEPKPGDLLRVNGDGTISLVIEQPQHWDEPPRIR